MELMATRIKRLKLASKLSISFGLCTKGEGELAERGATAKFNGLMTTAEFLNCLNQIATVRIMIET